MTSEEIRAAGQDMAGVQRTVSDSELVAKREEKVAQAEQEAQRQEQREQQHQQQQQKPTGAGESEKAAAAPTDLGSKDAVAPSGNTSLAVPDGGANNPGGGTASEEITTTPVGGPVLVDDDWSGIEEEAQSLVPQSTTAEAITPVGGKVRRSSKAPEPQTTAQGARKPEPKASRVKPAAAAKKAEEKKTPKPQAGNSPAQKAKAAVPTPQAPAKKAAAPVQQTTVPKQRAVAPAKPAAKAPVQRAAAPAQAPAPVVAAPEAEAVPGQTDAAPNELQVDEIQGLLAARDAGFKPNDQTTGQPEAAAETERTGRGDGGRDSGHGGLPDAFQAFDRDVCEKLSLADRELKADMPALQRYDGQLPLAMPANYYRSLESYARKHGLAMNPVQLMKNRFVCTLLPIATRMNTQVFRQRLEVLRLQTRDKWGALTAEDKTWLDELKTAYRLPTSASYEQLLERVDVVPISLLLGQGSWESNWGSSELAKKANNLFGMKAAKGQPPFFYLKVSWRKFNSLAEGIAGYIELLNTGPYRHYRAARGRMRAQGQRLDSVALVASLKLDGYAQDPAYVQKISGAIRENSFRSHELVESEIALREGERPGVKIGDQQRVAQ
jgi:Bax protein